MRKLYFSLIILLLSIGVQAQEYEYEPDIRPVKLKMGINAGLTFPTITTTDSIKINVNTVGYNYGFNMTYGNSLFLRIDLSFHSFGSEITVPDTADASILYKSKVGLNYFHVPVQLGYVFTIKEDKVKGRVAAGVFYELLYRATDKELLIKRKDFFESGVGYTGSVGVDISRFTTQVSYAYGVGPVLNTDYDSRKNILSVSFGFRF